MGVVVYSLLLALLASQVESSSPCNANANNEFVMKVNYEAPAITGEYVVEGCVGNSPVLHIKRGVTYTFLQHHVTNYKHPIGFAYYPDGAHGYGMFNEVPELEYPTPADCDLPDFKCNPGKDVKQAPLYGIDGVFEDYGDWNNGQTSGLDVYEPAFLVPEDQWKARKFSIRVTIPLESKTKEFFYFCHIHYGMSGMIKVVDHLLNANPLIQPFDPSTYYTASNPFDTMCGTSGVSKYTKMNKQCRAKSFLCGPPQNKPFRQCMEAIDCFMHNEMSVKEHSNPLVVFMHQMIPHHLNAVNMARIALKHSMTAPGHDDDSDLDIPALMRGIINGQNHEIQQMTKWLKKHGSEKKLCHGRWHGGGRRPKKNSVYDTEA